MKTFAILFLATAALVLVATLPLEADDDASLLDQLGNETLRLTRSADSHSVTIAMGNSQQHRGVLMGSRPWVVVPFATQPLAPAAKVTLADGRVADAKRVFGDAELGVAVYELQGDAATGLSGLDAHRSWDLERGQLVVAGGRAPALALIDGIDRVAGRLRAGETPPGALLLDTSGRVVGLGGAGQSCATCHAPSSGPILTSGAAGRWVTFQDYTTTPGSYKVEIVRPGDTAPNDVRLVPGQLILRSVAGHVVAPDGGYAYGAVISKDPHAVTVHPGHYVAGPVLARVLDDLEQHGRVRYAYLGVVPGQMTKADGRRGVKLAAVLDGSPAAAAGLEAESVLFSIDGHACRDPGSIGRLLVQAKPGATVTLVVLGHDDVVSIVLGDRGEARDAQVTPADVGLEVVELDDSLRAYLRIDDDVQGVLVTQVALNTPAARAGIVRGNVITHGAGGPVRDVPELEAVLATADGSVQLTVRNDRFVNVLTLKLPAPDNRRAR